MTQLPTRQEREAEYESIASEQNIIVGSKDGNCQRDAVQVTLTMYENFADALRSNYSEQRPATPVLYLDATGGSLGRGITHVEVGSADFIGDTKQSRSTLAPLGLYE
eukprot:6180697-Pleurochrysis_carterae.AAC.1